ncbi:MAG: NADH oxidase [Phyllobacteriaceae bacterium]|nr:NADH oxidase [Phyllobacteriaceae bacterium]
MELTVKELKERLDKGEDVHLLDVREPWEHEEFNIGGRLIPVNDLLLSFDKLEDLKDKEIVVYCRSGSRSAMAVALLKAQGFKGAINLAGGMIAWKEAFG